MAKQTFTTGQVLTAAQMTSLQQTAMGGGSTTAKTTSYVLTAADAGTVVQMNAAGATTITVNTALFAAGDSVQIQNIGAGVCTITAGTATVSTAGSLALSQYEGGTLYFNSTGAAIFFDWVQSSGASSALTLVKRSSFSSVATTTTTFDSVFSSTYAQYLIVIENMWCSSGGATGYFQWRVGGSTQTGQPYYGAAFGYATGGPGLTTININSTTQGILSYLGGSAVVGLGMNLVAAQVGASGRPQLWGSGMDSNNNLQINTGFYYNSTITTDGFILSASAGNISGTIAIYGLAK